MGFLDFLWVTIGWWLVPLLVIFLVMTAIIFFFRMIGFIIVQVQDRY